MKETVDKNRSFAYFVYPFVFNHPPDQASPFESLARQIDTASFQGKNVWGKCAFPPADLMPHVGRFLNPPDSADQAGRAPTARMWKLSDGLAEEYGLDRRAMWRLSFRNREIPFRFGETGDTKFAIRLALFSIGIGFVTINAAPQSEDLGDWLDFIHAFRFLRGRRGVTARAEKRTGKDQVTPFTPVGVTTHGTDYAFPFMELVEGLLRVGVAAQPPWWRPVFVPDSALPYVSIFLGETSDEARPAVLYRTRNFFHSEQVIHPTAEDLRVDHPMNLAYAGNQSFLFSLNGGAYVAFPPHDTTFFRETLPDHLRNTYFLAFLLVLHQRFALAMLSEQVVQHGLVGSDEEQENAFERIRDSLLLFTARGYFAQAMQSDHHHRYYRKWQEVLQIPQLYDEVRNEVRDMYERATLRLRKQDDEREKREEEREKRFEKLLTILGAVFIVPSLILSFLGVNLRGMTSGDEGLAWHSVALLVVASMGVGGLLLSLLTRRLGRGDDKSPGRGHRSGAD